MFEANVLVPLFLYSKVVKIFDRWVGNSIVTRSPDGKVLDQAQVTERFQAALDWIVGVFIRTSRQSPRLLEVYSGVDTRSMDKKEIAIVASALKAFENEIRAKYSFPEFRLIVKEETQQVRMLHSRYLITDQLGVVMERGFDLLMDDGMMRGIGLDPRKDRRRIQDCVVTHFQMLAKSRALFEPCLICREFYAEPPECGSVLQLSVWRKKPPL